MSTPGDVMPVGDGAVFMVLGKTADAVTISRVWSTHAALQDEFGQSVLDIVPAFASILIRFDPSAVRLATVMATARGVLEAGKTIERALGRTLHVSVCFHKEYALDLTDVARHAGLSEEEAVQEFCRPSYRVAFLGFTAGFPYLIGLPRAFEIPRLPTPRVRVPAGSVAIAAGQCGVYPRSSPGGWRILGRTSANLFDPSRERPALFAPADKVVFHPVDSLERATASVEP